MLQTGARPFTVKTRYAFALWLALLAAVSMFPLPYKHKLHIMGHYHDLSHYLGFLITGLFLWFMSDAVPGRLIAFLVGAAFSYSQEWAENALYHAGFEPKDVETDIAGLITAFSLMILIKALVMDSRSVTAPINRPEQARVSALPDHRCPSSRDGARCRRSAPKL